MGGWDRGGEGRGGGGEEWGLIEVKYWVSHQGIEMAKPEFPRRDQKNVTEHAMLFLSTEMRTSGSVTK